MSKRGCLLIGVIVAIVVVILVACGLLCVLASSGMSDYNLDTLGESDYEEVVSGGQDKIAIIDVEGVIMDVDDTTDLW